jgi:hypothetical protein
MMTRPVGTQSHCDAILKPSPIGITAAIHAIRGDTLRSACLFHAAGANSIAAAYWARVKSRARTSDFRVGVRARGHANENLPE